MKADQAIKQLKEKFKSGNDIPVTRAAITFDEFEALEEELLPELLVVMFLA